LQNRVATNEGIILSRLMSIYRILIMSCVADVCITWNGTRVRYWLEWTIAWN